MVFEALSLFSHKSIFALCALKLDKHSHSFTIVLFVEGDACFDNYLKTTVEISRAYPASNHQVVTEVL